jgi:hypothetical protein
LLASLAATHSPAELHVYILDFGGRQLMVFRDLPHVGAIITADEEERITRLLRRLDRLLEERKTLLSDAGADDLYSFNEAHPGAALPAILVMVDNFAEFREGFDQLMPLLISLVRESRAYGIHFVVSAELPNALGGKLYTFFTERVALKLSDPVEYAGIVGRGARAVEDIPGRGYVKVGRGALELQVALPVGDSGEGQVVDETQKLAALVRAMRDAPFAPGDAQRPQPILTLAGRVRLVHLLESAPPVGARTRPVLAIDDRNLEPWNYDARGDGPHGMIIGPPASGKTTTLRSLVLSLAHSYTPEQVMLVLIDVQQRFFRYGGQWTLADLPHVVAVASQPEELPALVTQLETECNHLGGGNRAIFLIIDNYDSFIEEARSDRQSLPALAKLAREKGTDGFHVIIAGSADITRSAEELRKQVQMPRMGIALQSADLVSSLNGRVPRALVGAELPLGRGFVVKAGRSYMVQIATPYEDDEQIETALDAWVEQLRALHAGKQARWTVSEGQAETAEPARMAAQEAPRVEANARQPAAAATTPADGNQRSARPSRGIPEGVDVEALKPQLIARGLAPSLLALLSPIDIYHTAVEMKILIPDAEESRTGG